MDVLKKILFALIGVLVVIVAAGGAYLGLNSGTLGKHANMQVAQNQQPGNSQQQANQNPQNSATGQQNSGTDPNQHSGGHTPDGQQNQTPGTSGQQAQAPGLNGQQPQTPGSRGQQPQVPGPNAQQPQFPPVPYPVGPQVRVIDPEPYYDRLNKAQEIIQDANKMITVDPFANSGKDAANSSADMSKIHQGIYKMSQGMAIMENTLDSLNKDIKGESKFGPSPNQPVYPGYYYPGFQQALPYGYNQQNWPYGYNPQNWPYGYNPQYPYNQAPGTPYPQQPNQNQPNSQSNNQTNNQANSQQHPQPPGNQSVNHNTGAANLFGNFSVKQILTYVAYGIMLASIVAVFVAIIGMVNSMFKKPENSQSA